MDDKEFYKFCKKHNIDIRKAYNKLGGYLRHNKAKKREYNINKEDRQEDKLYGSKSFTKYLRHIRHIKARNYK